jgi:predicted PurR-regulated permease PerM
MESGVAEPSDRRQVERRGDARIADLSLPEIRRIVLTTALFAVVLGLFLWMVRAVFVAGVLGVVAATYTRPLYRRILGVTRHRTLSALLTLAVSVLPVLAALVYSYVEVLRVVAYLGSHQNEVATQIERALHRFGFAWGAAGPPDAREWVMLASTYGSSLPRALRSSLTSGSIGASVFLFTAFYILTDASSVVAYVRGKIPPRYADLSASLERNVRGVLYGAVYGTLVTQALKSAVVLVLNVAFGVPLAVALAIISFIVGFFPIVGSWSVYVPVAAWLLVFRDALVPAVLMLVIGFVVNTMFISMYVRPKLAAAKSRVLNFYWMFIGLIAGVYAFGLPGVILGPILIGLLKAVIDTVTTPTSWGTSDDHELGRLPETRA